MTLVLMFLVTESSASSGVRGKCLVRVMGMILAAVAVEMVYSAIKGQLGPE